MPKLGTYILRDDLHLGTPPPHHSETPPTNLNPLATTPTPPTAGVKLSLIVLGSRKANPQFYRNHASAGGMTTFGTYSIKESEKESRASHETASDEAISHPTSNGGSEKPPAFGAGNALLAHPVGKDGLKRRKPKNNIIKSNSSFVSRVIQHDAMSKRLQERSPEGLFAFANINRAFQWLDLSPNTTYKVKLGLGPLS